MNDLMIEKKPGLAEKLGGVDETTRSIYELVNNITVNLFNDREEITDERQVDCAFTAIDVIDDRLKKIYARLEFIRNKL